MNTEEFPKPILDKTKTTTTKFRFRLHVCFVWGAQKLQSSGSQHCDLLYEEGWCLCRAGQVLSSSQWTDCFRTRWIYRFSFFFFGHVLFQQYCDSAYNKLSSLQQKEFIDITKMNYIWKKEKKRRRERRRQTHMYSRTQACTRARTHARTHTRTHAHARTPPPHTHTHNSKLKFKQLNGPTNRSKTILTK